MPRAVALEDNTVEIEPTSQRLTALRTAGKPYRFFSVEHPLVGSQVEIGKRVYEVEAGPDETRIVLKLVRVVP